MLKYCRKHLMVSDSALNGGSGGLVMMGSAPWCVVRPLVVSTRSTTASDCNFFHKIKDKDRDKWANAALKDYN